MSRDAKPRSSHTTLSWAQIRRFRVQIAFGLLIVLGLCFLLLVGDSSINGLQGFLAGVSTSLAAGLIIYLCAELVLAKAGISAVDQLRDDIADRIVQGLAPAPGVTGVYSHLNSVPWTDLFEATQHKVTIVARFFDGTLSLAGEGALVDLFRRGGIVEVITPDPKNKRAMREALEQRVSNPQVRHRPIEQRLVGSINLLLNAARIAGRDESVLRHYYYEGSINYAAYCFDEEVLLLQPYEHTSHYGVRAPRIRVDLRLAPSIREFWGEEVAGLFTEARKQGRVGEGKSRSTASKRAREEDGDGR